MLLRVFVDLLKSLMTLRRIFKMFSLSENPAVCQEVYEGKDLTRRFMKKLKQSVCVGSEVSKGLEEKLLVVLCLGYCTGFYSKCCWIP